MSNNPDQQFIEFLAFFIKLSFLLAIAVLGTYLAVLGGEIL